jgi:hypothetical protein
VGKVAVKSRVDLRWRRAARVYAARDAARARTDSQPPMTDPQGELHQRAGDSTAVQERVRAGCFAAGGAMVGAPR